MIPCSPQPSTVIRSHYDQGYPKLESAFQAIGQASTPGTVYLFAAGPREGAWLVNIQVVSITKSEWLLNGKTGFEM